MAAVRRLRRDRRGRGPSARRARRRQAGEVRGPQTLELVPNADILATLAATKGPRRCVGFALQVEDAERRAREKLQRKALDAIVVDSPAAMGADRADFTLIPRSGPPVPLPGATKDAVAAAILRFLGG